MPLIYSNPSRVSVSNIDVHIEPLVPAPYQSVNIPAVGDVVGLSDGGSEGCLVGAMVGGVLGSVVGSAVGSDDAKYICIYFRCVGGEDVTQIT